MLKAIDIETACNLECTEKCQHALDEHRNRITVVGTASRDGSVLMSEATRNLVRLRQVLEPTDSYVFHSGKFDLRSLATRGIDLSAQWAHDTQIMAAVLMEKVSPEYLEWYEARRKIENAKLPRGYSHRPGSLHSLKVLAPFFLGVEPFWESPENHDSDEYVRKDVEYTLRLYEVLETKLKAEGSWQFYNERLMPWCRMLLGAEQKGIAIDLSLLDTLDKEALQVAAESRAKLDELWAHAYETYFKDRVNEVWADYKAKSDAATAKLKKPTPEKVEKTRARYLEMGGKARDKLPTKMNLDSPAQLSWLLRDYLKLDITDFDGEETTGKAVLQKLAGTGREDIAQFLRYRKAKKLTTAFFPSYREMNVGGVIHCNFNPTGTRTGRLSSSSPNLQQVERGIHKLFVARPGLKLATYDMSAIEPRLIAYYTSDLNLYDIVAKGEDFHGYNSKIFFDLNCPVSDIKKKYPLEREVGKEVSLAIMYGAGTTRLQESAQKRGFIWNQRECRYKLDRFKEFYEGVFKFRDEVLNPHMAAGGSVTNLLGRQFRIDDPTDVHMKSLNTTIQSSASDLVINSAHRIQQQVAPMGGNVLLLVHDEIVTEIPADREAECVEIITRAMTDYDLKCDLGPIELAVEGKVSERWEK